MHACWHARLVQRAALSLGHTPAQQADDLALAKAMQEQERAFHWLTTQAAAAQPDAQPAAA